MDKKKLDKLSTQYYLARAYESLTLAEGWDKVEEDIRSIVEETGRCAVYPGFKSEIEHDRLVEARAWLKLIQKIKFEARKREQLNNQLKELGIVAE